MKKIILISIVSLNGIYAQDIEKTSALKEVVISGNKIETEKKEITQTIDVLTSTELKFNSLGNTGDVLQNTGMITVQQSQNGGGSPVIRGFEANRLGIVVDGVRMNTAIFRAGHLQNVLRIDNSQLDRLEVLYGAGSTLFGSDALGGVLNFQTIKPKLNNGLLGSAFIRYANATDEKTGGVTLNYGLAKFASVTSFTFSSFGNVMSGNIRDAKYGNWGKRLYYAIRENNKDIMVVNSSPNEQIGSSYDQYNILQKFLFQPNGNTSHLFNFQYSNSSDINRYDRLTETSDKLSRDENPTINKFSNAEWFYGPEARLMAAYTLNHYIHSTIAENVRFTGAYQNYKESRNSRKFGKNDFISQLENVDIASVNLDMFKRIKQHQLTYGLEGIINWISSSASSFNISTGAKKYATTRYPDGGSQTGSYAVFVQDVWELTKDLAYINLGLRGSYHTINSTVIDTNRKYGSFEINNFAYSANAGLSLLPTKNNKITLNISSGYRTPNLDDVSKIYESNLFLQVNNPDVKPEMVINYEINSNNKIGRDVALEVGVYYTSITDYIKNVATTVNGNSFETINGQKYAYQKLSNATSAYIFGGYGMLKIKLNSNFDLFGNLNYTYGRVKQTATSAETPLDHIPPISGKMAMQYHLNKFNSEFSILWNSAKESADYSMSGEDNIDKSADPVNGYMPAWYTLNLRTSYIFTKNLSAQASLENILDTHYRVFASGISSSGRGFRVTLRSTF